MDDDAMAHIMHGDVLGTAALSDEELARICGVALSWVHEHVQAGILLATQQSGQRRFDSVTLIRARRIADLEAAFGADPQHAALTTDLIEEVGLLRRRLGLMHADDVHDA